MNTKRYLFLFSLLLIFSLPGFSQTGSITSLNKISATAGTLGDPLGSNNFFGLSVENMGDFDGDGVTDIAVGATGYNGKGAVLICLLNANGTVKSRIPITQGLNGFSQTLTNGQRFAYDIANIGDLDNDGVTDIVVSQESNSDANFNEGAIYVLFLNANGTVKSDVKITSATTTALAPVLDGNDRFGTGVAAIGDLDGDGNEDVAVTALLDDDGGSGRGAAYILFLNSNGTMKSFQKISDTQGGFLGTLDDGDNFGSSVESIGDFDNDGNTDIAVGAYLDDDGGTFSGAVWLLYLNSNGTVKGFDKISQTSGGMSAGPFSNSYFGYSIANLGDIDGDGITDIATGAINELSQRGAIYTMTLNANGTVKNGGLRVTSNFNMPQSLDFGDWFGSGMVGMGDINGDGKRDMVVGTQNDDDGNSNSGAVYLAYLDGVAGCAVNAGFTASQDTVCVGGAVTFTNTSSGATGAVWRENGTVFSTATSPSRTFNALGTYSIRLTADDGSCADSTSMNIEVVNPPTAIITPLNGTNVCFGDTAFLQASGGTSFQWFLNGTPIPGATNPVLPAFASGNYSVQVASVCADTDSVQVRVGLQTPIWTDLVNALPSNDTLFKTSNSNQWGSCGAASKQVLQPGQDGGVSHLIHDPQGVYYFGLSSQNIDAGQKTIDHAFYYYKGNLRVREASGTNINVGGANLGDSLAIARVGSNLTWLVNGTPVHSTTVNNNQYLIADVSIQRKNSYITDIFVSFCDTTLPFSISGMFRNNVCANAPSGWIKVMANGGVGPYTYNWSTGATTDSVFALGAGNYCVTVMDGTGQTDSLCWDLVNMNTWVDEVGANASVDTLDRAISGSSWGTSGARTREVLQPGANGWFEHVLGERRLYYYWGLSSQDPDVSQLSIGYSFYVRGNSLWIRELSGYFAAQGTANAGDTLRIERNGTTLSYYQNGNLLRNTTVSNMMPLFGDISLYTKNASVADFYSSICTDSLVPSALVNALSLNHSDCFQSNGSVTLNTSGGVPPYTYLWAHGPTTGSLSGLAAGTYTCYVGDQAGLTDTVELEILNRVVWEGFANSTASGDTLQSTASAAQWCTSGARSDNKLLNGLSGKVQHVVSDKNKVYYIGLSDADPDACQLTIDYAFYVQFGNLRIREEKTGYNALIGPVENGDTLVVERRISSMYWYKNDSLLRSIGISPTETLRVDVSLYTPGMQIFDTYVDFCDTIVGQKWAGQQDLSPEPQTRIFPNPAAQTVHLEFSGQANVELEVELMDLNGKVLRRSREQLNSETYRGSFDLRGISKGLYLIRFRQEDRLVLKKLIVE